MTEPVPTADFTHPRLRCGTPGPQAISLCGRCNPGRLAQPASSEAHGTAFLGIGIAVIALAVAAQFPVGGVGPFTGRVTGAVPDDDGLRLSPRVRDGGSREGRATCRVWDPAVLLANPAETTIRTRTCLPAIRSCSSSGSRRWGRRSASWRWSPAGER